ncbi:MAG: hypothetical protein IT460_17240 [Planctomycetes bacterium]|nr:hypothetical protein [Planctomycetota bacterium]
MLVRPGQVVTAGEPIVDLARDAYPRPNLALTDAVLRPLNEEFHRAITDLRNAAQALAISREELARIRAAVSGAGSAGLLPGRREIELANDERRALASLESARADARIHGLSDEDVARIESGGALAYTSPPVRAVLQRNRLWGPEGDAILDALPEADRDNPYVLAVVGELVASRRLSPALVNAVRTRPALANAFLDVAGLIQAGATAESLAWLAEAGALDPIVVVRCPPDLPDADVDSVAVRPGQRVEAGSALLTLADEREMRLVVAPAGEDIAAIEESYRRQEPLVAEPLVVRSGPRLGDVRVARMASAEGRESRPMAWISLPNEPLGTTELAPGVRARTWRLRAGTRYVVKVPVERLEKRFVLPADAVVSRGADQVVFLRAGSSFRAVAVHVEHRDAAVSVVADDGPLFEGDSAVLRGAYALSLALQAGQGAAADPHAGHQH